jgi:hypothetical protein
MAIRDLIPWRRQENRLPVEADITEYQHGRLHNTKIEICHGR